MASLFLSRGFSRLTNRPHRLRRNLSSFNNNRTKTGIITTLNEDDLDFNLWSENNWSQMSKQLNTISKFPLPGQVGIVDLQKKHSLLLKQQETVEKQKEEEEEEFSKQFDLFYRPLPSDHQMNTLMQVSNKVNDDLAEEKKSQKINKNSLELKAHKCPIALAKDFQNYFPTTSNPLTVITVSLKAENDMSTYNNAVEEEREMLMDSFVELAKDICVQLKKDGHWVDFIDPSSGRPYMGPFTHATFFETDERYRDLGFDIKDYGCCKVISHHKWGTKSYVGCVITSASNESSTLKSILSSFK